MVPTNVLNSLAKLVAKSSMKIQGKGHPATKTNGSNGINEVQKTLQEKQRERSDIFASSKSSVFDFFGQSFLLDLAQSEFSL